MTYALVLRRQTIHNINYYQVLEKVIGERDLDDVVHVVSGSLFLNQDLNPCGTNDEFVYLEIEKEVYDRVRIVKTEFFKEERGNLIPVDDIIEQNQLALYFFNHYHDFSMIPEYDTLQLISNLKEELLKKVIGQDKAISKIVTKLYNNLIFLEANLDPISIQKQKSNLLIMGPFGTGKTTIKKVIQENLAPIPVIEYQLTGNYKTDISDIFQKLMIASDGNIYLASRGIVIFDGISSLSSTYIDPDTEEIHYYLDTLLQILKTEIVRYTSKDQKEIGFNYSSVTNICMIDINYDYEKEDTDLYTRIDFSKVLELGMTPEFLLDYFDNEIIYMEEMTFELAERILKDKEISPLYQIKKVLEKKGKTVHIARDFVKELIWYGLDFNEGFEGITRALKYVLQSKDIKKQNITFKKEDFSYQLEIGTVFPEEEEDYSYQEEIKDETGDLKVDSKKKTINNLTKKEVIALLKRNIKGQDDQIFSIVNSFFEHILTKSKGFSQSDYRRLKDNILLIGPTGVGKTSIVLNLIEILKIPFIRVDATSYSETGIVGKDVESIVKDLVKICNGDVRKAETGVVFIDELDKIASNFDRVDIGKGVQNALLTLIEGNKITITPGYGEFFPSYTIDTSKILFIGAGAYEGLDEIMRKRIRKERNGTSIGFKEEANDSLVRDEITIDDLSKFGMSSQLIARLPEVIKLNSLNEEVLFHIVTSSENGYVNLKLKSYQYDGVIIKMSEGFKRSLAKASYRDGKGARSIKTIFKRVLTEIDKNNLENDLEEVILGDESLNDYGTIQYVKRKNRRNV